MDINVANSCLKKNIKIRPWLLVSVLTILFFGFLQIGFTFAQPAACTENPTEKGDPSRCQSSKEVLGWADTHAHPFANLAFGGWFITGSPYNHTNDPSAVNSSDPSKALAPAYKPTFWPLNWDPASWIAGAIAWIGMGEPWANGVNHQGWPKLDHWPLYNSAMFQKIYVDWLKRSYDYGLRLVVFHPVNNEALCIMIPHDPNLPSDACKDMVTGEWQLKAMKNFVNQIPWMEIAYTPQDARRIIGQENKLAVVLGYEVDSMFNCGSWVDGQCKTEKEIRSHVDRIYNLGVRHFYPIHLYNNEFGGTALSNSFFIASNGTLRKAPIDIGACQNRSNNIFAAGTDVSFEYAPFWIQRLINVLAGLSANVNAFTPVFQTTPAVTSTGHCNNKGLTWKGEVLIKAIMNKGMMLEVDHMSARMLKDVWDIAQKESPHKYRYPVIAGHTQIRDRKLPKDRKENDKNIEAVRLFLENAGMVALNALPSEVSVYKAGPNDLVTETMKTDNYNVCKPTSRSYAQILLEGLNIQQLIKDSNHDIYPGMISMSTDMSTPGGGGLAPRLNCGDTDLLMYGSNTVLWPNSPEFQKVLTQYSMAGTQKTWDYNKDGLAHYGLLPDMIADLNRIGVSQSTLDPLLNSAEGYIQLWEKSFGEVNVTLDYKVSNLGLLEPDEARMLIGTGGVYGITAHWHELSIEAENIKGWNNSETSFELTSMPGNQCWIPRKVINLSNIFKVYCATSTVESRLNNYSIDLKFDVSGRVNSDTIKKTKEILVQLPQPSGRFEVTDSYSVEQASCDYGISNNNNEDADYTPWTTPWQNQAVLFESPHPYSNNASSTISTVTIPGASKIQVHFERIGTQRHKDYIVLKDVDGNEFTRRTGDWTNEWSPILNGDTIHIAVISDESSVGYGYKIDHVQFQREEVTPGLVLQSQRRPQTWRHNREVNFYAENFAEPAKLQVSWKIFGTDGNWYPGSTADFISQNGDAVYKLNVPVCPCQPRIIQMKVADGVETLYKQFSVEPVDMELQITKKLERENGDEYNLENAVMYGDTVNAEVLVLGVDARFRHDPSDQNTWAPIPLDQLQLAWDLRWDGKTLIESTPIPIDNILSIDDNQIIKIFMGDYINPETEPPIIDIGVLPEEGGPIELEDPVVIDVLPHEGSISVDSELMSKPPIFLIKEYSAPKLLNVYVNLRASLITPDGSQASCNVVQRCTTNAFDGSFDDNLLRENDHLCLDLTKDMVRMNIVNP